MHFEPLVRDCARHLRGVSASALSHVSLCSPIDYSLSMEFPRQGYWNGLLFPSPGDLPDPGIKPKSPALQADSLPLNHQGSSDQRLLLLSHFSRVRLCATP